MNSMAKGCWRIAYWDIHTDPDEAGYPYYTQVTYTPVVSVGLEHDICSPACIWNPLLDKSFVSYTIIADILYRSSYLDFRFTGSPGIT